MGVGDGVNFRGVDSRNFGPDSPTRTSLIPLKKKERKCKTQTVPFAPGAKGGEKPAFLLIFVSAKWKHTSSDPLVNLLQSSCG